MHYAAKRNISLPRTGKCERGGKTVTVAKGNAAKRERSAITNARCGGDPKGDTSDCSTFTDASDAVDCRSG